MKKSKEPFYQYVEGVINGTITTGKYIRLAVERFLNDIDTGDFVFDFNKGKRVIDFAEKLCRHHKGVKAGTPFILAPHQHFYIIQQFGWYTKQGTRRFTQSYKEVARKNGKTSEEAIKALFMISKDGVQGAQVYCGATKEEQARILVNDAGNIATASPYLKNKFTLFKNRNIVNRVVYKQTNFIGALGRDSKTQDGLDPNMGIIDEYHAHPSDDLLNVIESGMGARANPMLDIITTAGFNRFGPCYSLRKNCIDVLEGIKTDETLLPLIFTLDENDDWHDQELWIKSNPNLNESVRLDFLKTRFIKAKNEGGSKEVEFKTKNLNIWTDSQATWIKDADWQACGKQYNADNYKGRKCFGGLDLSKTRDISAFTLLFPNDDDTVDVLFWFWLPEKQAYHRQSMDGIPYTEWANEGFITLTEGDVIDQRFIMNEILQAAEDYDIQSISYDRYSATQLIIDLDANGINLNPFGQGFISMGTPTATFEEWVISKKLRHCNNPVMRWMISNIDISRDAAGNIKIDKKKSTEKVDGPVSLVMAIGDYFHWQAAQPNTPYTGEILIL